MSTLAPPLDVSSPLRQKQQLAESYQRVLKKRQAELREKGVDEDDK
jgi:hypothetical protein